MLLKALPKVLHILVHQLKVGTPFVKLFPCHIVAGMEKQGNRPGLLADDFRRAVAGQLQVIHPMDLFLLHLVYQVGDGLGAWLRIRAAAGKRGRASVVGGQL